MHVHNVFMTIASKTRQVPVPRCRYRSLFVALRQRVMKTYLTGSTGRAFTVKQRPEAGSWILVIIVRVLSSVGFSRGITMVGQ